MVGGSSWLMGWGKMLNRLRSVDGVGGVVLRYVVGSAICVGVVIVLLPAAVVFICLAAVLHVVKVLAGIRRRIGSWRHVGRIPDNREERPQFIADFGPWQQGIWCEPCEAFHSAPLNSLRRIDTTALEQLYEWDGVSR